MALEADLTEAQLLFGGLGWTKPAGRAASSARLVPQEDGSTFSTISRSSGDDIDIQGGIALDAEQHLKEFHFSDFFSSAADRMSDQRGGSRRPGARNHRRSEL
jgi:hypothetical protein